MRPIRSCAELYAHAIAIEREAAQRYAELAERMGDLGNDAVAGVFGALARFEAEHLQALLHRTEGVDVPPPAANELCWPVSPPTSPREALFMALDAERRAHAFFESVLLSAEDPALRALAREMAMDEGEHIALLEQLLARPEAPADWSRILDKPPGSS